MELIIISIRHGGRPKEMDAGGRGNYIEAVRIGERIRGIPIVFKERCRVNNTARFQK